jgi:hypothetical protein
VFFEGRVEPRRPVGVEPASPLLGFIGGAFAPRIASLWPAPHADYLAAPAARRHLVCLALLHSAAIDGPALLVLPLKQAIRLAAPTAPQGLARSLERLGECAWSEADYRRLLRLLAGHATGKLLRHRDRISVDELRALDLLPTPLLDSQVARLLTDETSAGLVAEAFEAIAKRDGEAAALALAPRWGTADSLKALVEAVRLDLEPELGPPPFAGSERLRPLATKAAIIDASARFKNCLRSQVHYACSGDSAFYEWVEPPGAVLEITRDRLHGWILDQARLAENKPVPEPTRSAIVEDLQCMGVRVGRSRWDLDEALAGIGRTPRWNDTRTRAQLVGELFGDD